MSGGRGVGVVIVGPEEAIGVFMRRFPAAEVRLHGWQQADSQLPVAIGQRHAANTRDATEHSISGDGYRPTLNSYMYADAAAIAAIAPEAGETAVAREYAQKAEAQRERERRELRSN